MRKFSSYSYRRLVILAALSALFGCIGSGTPPAAIHHFLLDYPPPPAQNALCSTQSVKVLEFTTVQAYNSRSMIYSPSAFRRDAYHYSRWRVSPGEMISDYLERDLRKAGIFGGVFTYRNEESSRFAVEGTVDEFFENDEGRG